MGFRVWGLTCLLLVWGVGCRTSLEVADSPLWSLLLSASGFRNLLLSALEVSRESRKM